MSAQESARELLLPKTVALAGVVMISLCLPASADILAVTSANAHVTDGKFTSAQEWSGPNVTKTFFAQASDGSGGAFLYVEQGTSNAVATGAIGITPVFDTLYLLYDFVKSPAGSTDTNSFFDVFFQVPPTHTDYLVRILNTGNLNGPFLAFEKDEGTPSNFNADGTFDTGAPWAPLSSADLQLARFKAAIGFGPSPDEPANHLIAEFQLSLNNATSSTEPPNGLYDPSPAFWSASADPKTGPDPPISSGIFTLSPTGGTTVVPVLGPSGGPIPQPASVPEPSAVFLLGSCAALLCTRLVRRQNQK